MLCNQFSQYFDASGSVLEVKEREHRYLPKPEIEPEILDTADVFPDPSSNNARGAWLVGVDSEILDERIEEIEKEEKLKAEEKADKPSFKKKSDDESEEPAETDTENNSDEENSDAPADNDADSEALEAGEDILNIDEEVGEKDSGESEPEEEPKKKSSFSDMWRKKSAPEEDMEASEEE